MESLKVLFVGNSFSLDTAEFAAEIAHSLGISSVKFGVLYRGSCTIGMHYFHVTEDAPAYTYYLNEGDGWHSVPEHTISDAVKSEDWDWIVIQHGSGMKTRYTSCKCYEKLSPLIDSIKEMAPAHTKIAFNLTWLGESTLEHHEILSYDGNTALMREKLEETTQAMVVNNPKVDLLVPTGTAIENARTSRIGLLTRDCCHLSLDKGRFIACLAFVSTISGIDAAKISWVPDKVDDYALKVAIAAVQSAQKAPLAITKIDF